MKIFVTDNRYADISAVGQTWKLWNTPVLALDCTEDNRPLLLVSSVERPYSRDNQTRPKEG